MKILDWLIKHPSRFFLVALLAISLLLVVIDIVVGFNQASDWRGVLTEAHGMWLDIFVLGLLLTVYESLRNKKENIERYLEELDDYSHWNEEEAFYRSMGIIKRLTKLLYHEIDLYYLFLSKSNLNNILFKNNTIEGNNFDYSIIKNTVFSNSKIINNSLHQVSWTNNEFENCTIDNISSLSRTEQNKFNDKLGKNDYLIKKITNISIYHLTMQQKLLNLVLSSLNVDYETWRKGLLLEDCRIIKNSIIKNSFFSTSKFKNLLFENATISDTIILSSNFDSTKIIGKLVFYKTIFSGVVFSNSDLTNCKFVNCLFKGVSFNNCQINIMDISEEFHNEISVIDGPQEFKWS